MWDGGGLGSGAVKFTVLGSGSAGNAAVIEAGATRVLVDAGFSARQLCVRLEMAGVALESIDAVLLTHEHGDHVRGLEVLMRRVNPQLVATVQTAEVLRDGGRLGGRWSCFEAGQAFEIGDLRVESFPVMHDAVDPVGFVFRSNGSSLGFVSDAGHAPAQMVEQLSGLCGLFVEANYDVGMLEADCRRPWPTKQRISSRHGHLSNEQAAELAAGVAHPGLRRVVLGHLSRDCNQPELACRRVRERLVAAGWAEVVVECAAQHEPSGWFAMDGSAVSG